jgi:hypothetical protein
MLAEGWLMLSTPNGPSVITSGNMSADEWIDENAPPTHTIEHEVLNYHCPSRLATIVQHSN